MVVLKDKMPFNISLVGINKNVSRYITKTKIRINQNVLRYITKNKNWNSND